MATLSDKEENYSGPFVEIHITKFLAYLVDKLESSPSTDKELMAQIVAFQDIISKLNNIKAGLPSGIFTSAFVFVD